MEWLTTSASKKLICERCSNIMLFANGNVLVKQTKKKKTKTGGCKKKLSSKKKA